jgi:protein-tyrosine phosphatase
MDKEFRILMVCLGNICRSPMAEGIMRKKTTELDLPVRIDSAGTGGWHAGENPDRRAIKAMQQHHIDISKLQARQFQKEDFDKFDLILAMDESNLADILQLASHPEQRDKVKLILKYTDGRSGFSVPDPWYGDQDGFEKVYRLLEKACDQVIKTHFA